jgi:hypothetical protein
MRKYLENEIRNETKSRMEFNDLHYRYLPSNLKYLLEEPPTLYEIFPKHLVIDESQ